ncbi:prepilin-type N-terminal cleavage/methylation domain-containing protein [Clostridium isatidis]|nr:prepilin-type N-terminal cleavage/methylation domain-containing protein [Clostridium isatidis]
MKNNLKNKKKKGFTLIELIIVIAIIAIIAVIAIPRFGSATQNARRNSDIANAKNIANAVTMAIAEGDITLPAAAASPLQITIGGSDANATAVANLLQGTPTPESVDGVTAFTVNVTDTGDVTVLAGTTVLFPAP